VAHPCCSDSEKEQGNDVLVVLRMLSDLFNLYVKTDNPAIHP